MGVLLPDVPLLGAVHDDAAIASVTIRVTSRNERCSIRASMLRVWNECALLRIPTADGTRPFRPRGGEQPPSANCRLCSLVATSANAAAGACGSDRGQAGAYSRRQRRTANRCPGKEQGMTPAMNSTRRLSARAVALIGTGAVVAYALLAAVQILVWNPQAAVPGVGLDQIYADVAATGESMAAGMVIAFLAVGPLLAIALLVGAWRRPEGRASVVGVPFLVLLALGAPAYFWANFGPGMALADTFFVSGGDHSAWSAPLYVTSGLAVLALVGHVVWNRSSRQ